MPRRRLLRSCRAHLRYLRRPLVDFLPHLAFTLGLIAAGSAALHAFHDERLDWAQATFAAWSLIFAEPAYPYPTAWAARVFYWILPLAGLVVILDGILRFSYHILRRDDLSREWNRAMAGTMRGHVVLCGLGKLGLRVLEQLLQLGEEVTVLEKDARCANIAYARKHGVPVLLGTGREDGIFDDLNVAWAKSIIVATDDDLANLEIALDAKRLNPGIRVVLRLFDQELASKVRESFGISLAFSTSALAAPLFATSSTDPSILNSFYVRDRLLVLANLEIGAGSGLIGRTVRQLRMEDRALVVALERGDAADFYLDGETRLQAGDRISVQTEPQTLRELHRRNAS